MLPFENWNANRIRERKREINAECGLPACCVRAVGCILYHFRCDPQHRGRCSSIFVQNVCNMLTGSRTQNARALLPSCVSVCGVCIAFETCEYLIYLGCHRSLFVSVPLLSNTWIIVDLYLYPHRFIGIHITQCQKISPKSTHDSHQSPHTHADTHSRMGSHLAAFFIFDVLVGAAPCVAAEWMKYFFCADKLLTWLIYLILVNLQLGLYGYMDMPYALCVAIWIWSFILFHFLWLRKIQQEKPWTNDD